MKPRYAFLCATLALNAILGLMLVFRGSAPAPFSPADAPGMKSAASRSVSGLSEEIERNRSIGRAVERFAAHLALLTSTESPDPRYWRNPSRLRRANTPAQHAEYLAAQREFGETMRRLLGENVFSDPVRDAARAYLPPEKRDALQWIERDYEEQIAAIRRNGERLMLTSDRDAIKELTDAKERAVSALLSPEEYTALELRESLTAREVRDRFGEGIETEEDYRKIFALQKALDETYPDTGSPNRTLSTLQTMRLRGEADPELGRQIREAIGPEKFKALLVQNDQDRRRLAALSRQLNFPAGMVDVMIASRDAYAVESQRIYAIPDISPDDRHAQLQALAARARDEIARSLVPEAAAAYLQSATWLRYLDQGASFSADPEAIHAAIPTGTPLIFSSRPLRPLQPVRPVNSPNVR